MNKKIFTLLLFVIFSSIGAAVFAHSHDHDHHHHENGHAWEGVDHAVIEKFAEEAGRPPQGSFINPSGELLLTAFLLAGAIGGFVAGYYYRKIFSSGDNRG